MKCSIIISYKESGEDSKNNLKNLLNYLSWLLNIETEIVLVEQDIVSRIDWLKEVKRHEQINHIFVKNDGIFDKREGYVIGAKAAKGDYLVFNDLNVYLKLKSYTFDISLLYRSDVINPYKTIYYLDEKNSDAFVSNNYNFNIVITNKPTPILDVFNGIFMMKKEKFLSIEDFINIEDDKINELGLNIQNVNDFVIQTHDSSTVISTDKKSEKKIEVKNVTIDISNFSLTRLIPKRMFFYWSGNNLSWMRYMTLYSFRKYNPDWEVVLYLSDNNQTDKSWNSYESQDFHTYNGNNYFDKLKKLNIEIEKVEFPIELRDKLANISPIHKSDLFRYYQLFKSGGFYCDMDVLFFKPIDNFYDDITDSGCDTLIHEYNSGELTIGFLGSCVNNEFYKNLFEYGINNYAENNYQSMGIDLIFHMFGEKNIWNEIVSKYPTLKFYNLPTTLIYNYDWNYIDYCFINALTTSDFDYNSIGYHWYGGSPTSQKYNNLLTEKNYTNSQITFCEIADEVINTKIDKNGYVVVQDKPKISIIISYNESDEHRKTNLKRLLNYLSDLLDSDTEIVLVEQDNKSRINWLRDIKNHKWIKHIFVKNEGVFNKGWGYNIGAKLAKNDYLIFHDSDLFLKKYYYQSLLTQLDKFDVINPYNLICYLDETNSDLFVSTNYNFSIINNRKYVTPTVISGGIFMMKKEKYLALKGFDENCYGWGYEDSIFDHKVTKLGLKVRTIDNIVIHTYHDGIAGKMTYTQNNEYYSFQKRNELLYNNYLIMTEEQLKDNIERIRHFGEIDKMKPKKIKISIVTAYYNRKKLFYRTLKSIANSKFKNIEVIAVDDCSSPNERLEDLVDEFPFLKIIRLEEKDKWYVNPCVPFNKGIRVAIGDIIVLQNPECLHVHDVLTYISKNINDSNYLTVSAYGLNPELTDKLPSLLNGDFISFFKSLPQVSPERLSSNCWYNHSKFSPFYYHYCAAITKDNMDLLGGFDERYAYGLACDDDEFVMRIGKLGLEKIIVDDISVIHQWHDQIYQINPKFNELRQKNRVLLYGVTTNDKGYKVNENVKITK